MRKLFISICFISVFLLCSLNSNISYSDVQFFKINQEQIVLDKIYIGNPEKFSNPAEANRIEIIKSTKEYKEIINEKISKGSGKYWNLLSKASELSIREIKLYSKNNNYDLICESGYLKAIDELKDQINPTDITKSIVAKLEETK